MESQEEIRKPFIVANVRGLLTEFNRSEISFSFMVEKLNEMAFEYSDKKNQKMKDDFEDIRVLNVELNEDLGKLENELADSHNITDNLRNGNLVISRNRDEMEANYEKCKKDLEQLFSIADDMAGDLISQNLTIDGSSESVAKFYNFKQNITFK